MRGAKYKNVYMDLHLYHYRDEYALDITSPPRADDGDFA